MHTIIIDGDNLLHRAHWVAGKTKLITSQGEDVGTIFTSLKMIKSYVELFKATKVIVVWDKRLLWPSTNFRTEATHENYKGDRDKSETEAVHSQEDQIVEMLHALGVQTMNPWRMEADDVISWLSTTIKEGSITVVSCDADLYQLITDRIKVYHPIKKLLVSDTNFEEVAGIQKQAFILFKAIKGDPSDNIKGLHGYGPVKAKELALNWCTRKGSMSEGDQEKVAKNVQLIDLNIGYVWHEGEMDSYADQFYKRQQLQNLDQFKILCEKYEFKSILNSLDDWKNVFSGTFPEGEEKILTIAKVDKEEKGNGEKVSVPAEDLRT